MLLRCEAGGPGRRLAERQEAAKGAAEGGERLVVLVAERTRLGEPVGVSFIRLDLYRPPIYALAPRQLGNQW